MSDDRDPIIPELWRAAVERQIDSLKDQIEVLETRVHEAFGGLTRLTETLEERIGGLATMANKLENRLDKNTARIETIDSNTREVVEILRDWKGAMRVLQFTAKWMAPIGGIATVIAAVLKLFGVI